MSATQRASSVLWCKYVAFLYQFLSARSAVLEMPPSLPFRVSCVLEDQNLSVIACLLFSFFWKVSVFNDRTRKPNCLILDNLHLQQSDCTILSHATYHPYREIPRRGFHWKSVLKQTQHSDDLAKQWKIQQITSRGFCNAPVLVRFVD